MLNEVGSYSSSDIREKYRYYTSIVYLAVSLMLFFISPLLFIFFSCIFSPIASKSIVYLLSPLVLVFSILFYASLQPFSDLAEYMNVYHQVYNGEINIFSYDRFGYGIEIAILVIMKICAYISSGNDLFFLVSIYGVIFTYIYLISINVSKKYHLLIFISIFSSLGFVESLSYFLRQNLSVVFFLYGLLCTRSKKTRYIYFLLSFTAHISAIINILVYCFAVKYKGRVDNLQRAIKVGGVALVIFCLATVFLFSFPYGRLLYDKAMYVISNSQYSILPLPYILITIINVIFIILFSCKYRQENTVFYYLLIKEVLVFFLTLPLPAVPNRLGMIIFSYSFIFLFSMYSKNILCSKKYILNLGYILINSIPFFYSMYIITNHGNDLSFYLNKPITLNLFELSDYFYNGFIYGIEYINNGNST